MMDRPVVVVAHGTIAPSSLGECLVAAIVFLIVGVGAALWLMRLDVRDRRRRDHGAIVCPRCGYDLRGSSGRCPECGEMLA